MLEKLQTKFIVFWHSMQPRERIVLTLGVLLASGLIFYLLILKPWHRALNNLQEYVVTKRVDLVWLRQQAELVKNGGVQVKAQVKGKNQSLMAVVEQTAKLAGIEKAIKQMVPRENNKEVSVVFEEVSFNKWLRWTDTLQRGYGVKVKQLTADRESDQPDIAEIRVTLER